MRNHKLLTSFKNLLPLEDYSYVVESTNANWPVIASPASGSFKALKTIQEIETDLNFCYNPGTCNDPGTLEHSLKNCSFDEEIFAEIRISLMPPHSDQIIHSSVQRISCDECSQSHFVNLNSTTNTNTTTITGNITNLIKNNTYNYLFESMGGNYPLNIEKVSGTFLAKNEQENLTTEVNFCCPSGACNGTVFPKTYNSINNQILSHDIKLKVTDTCSDKISYNIVNISQTKPNLVIGITGNTNLTPDTKGCGRLNTLINNCIKNHTYHYSYKIIENNWPVYLDNISGVFTGRSGSVDVSSNLTFCPSSGFCVGASGVIQPNKIYSTKIDNYCHKNQYISLYLEVSSNCYPETMVFTSDPITVYCKDCIGSPSIKINQ